MPKNKIGIIILFLLITSLGISNQVNGLTTNPSQTDRISYNQSNVPPAPELLSISPEKTLYEIGEEITIEYIADRYQVDGVIIVGVGSGLTTDPDHGLNMTLYKSYKDQSYYKVTLNITSFTKFWAWAWSGTIQNRTVEELEPFAHGDKAHYIFVEGQQLPPELISVAGATQLSLEATKYYAPTGSNVTIKYEIKNATGTEKIYLAFATNKTILYNDTVQLPESTDPANGYVFFVKEMQLVSYAPALQDKPATYETTITFNEKTLYFAAKGPIGWELDPATLAEPRVNMLTNGFSLNSTQFDHGFAEGEKINVTITAINATQYDTFYLRYRIYENLTTTEAGNWTTVQLSNPIVSNVTIDNKNSTKFTFSTLIGPFEANKSIEYQAFTRYLMDTQNETDNSLHRVNIYPIRPYGKIEIDYEYTNAQNYTITWTTGTFVGEITNVTLLVNNTFVATIMNEENYTIELPIEGYYLIELNITNSYNASTIVNATLIVDRTKPTLTVTGLKNNTKYISGEEIILQYSDNSTFWQSGIKQVLVDWGDGVIIDATNLTKVKHYYLKDGKYNITITVIDNAGNNNTITYFVTVDQPLTIPTSTYTAQTPFSTITIIGSSIAAITIITKKRKNNFKN